MSVGWSLPREPDDEPDDQPSGAGIVGGGAPGEDPVQGDPSVGASEQAHEPEDPDVAAREAADTDDHRLGDLEDPGGD